MTSTPQTARADAGARAEARSELATDLDDPRLYLNRELSWLDFNDRVLAEAQDPRNPLLERVKFVAITSSNLDEFYAKRIGWLQRLLRTNPARRTVDGLSVAAQLMQAKERCATMRQAADALWVRELRPALAAAGVRIVSFDSLNDAEQAELGEYFKRMILPVLTPLVVDPAHPFPFISGGSLSLVIELADPASGIGRFARVKVPPNRQRFIEIGDGRFMPIEEVIGAFLHLLFTGVEVRSWNMVRVLRSADIGEPGEAAQDLRELIESQLEQRRLASAVTLEAPAALPPDHRRLLLDELDSRRVRRGRGRRPDRQGRADADRHAAASRSRGPPVHSGRALLVRESQEPCRAVRAAARAGRAGQPPLRVLRRNGGPLRGGRRARPAGARDQADAVPHFAGLARAGVADRRARARASRSPSSSSSRRASTRQTTSSGRTAWSRRGCTSPTDRPR